MKLRIFNNRGKFSPSFCYGKPMWTTRDGQCTHYEREYGCWFSFHKYGDNTQITITPSVFINRWHKGSICSVDDLGIITHTCGIGIRFWNWYGIFTFIQTLNTKTTEEINANLTSKGLNLVL